MSNIQGVFIFHDHPGPIYTDINERKTVTVKSSNGPVQVEVGLMEGKSDVDGTRILNPFVKNFGEGIFHSEKDQVIYPSRIGVVFRKPEMLPELGYQLFNRKNKAKCIVQTEKNRFVGIRDAWLKEPTAYYADKVGKDLYLICLEDVGPYEPFPAKYHNEVIPGNPVPGEDSLSIERHRIRGGMKYMWEVVITDNPDMIDLTVAKTKKSFDFAKVWQMAGMSTPEERSKRTERYQKILDSMRRAEYKLDADGTKNFSWIWYFMRGTDRFWNWAATDPVFDVSDKAQNIGWKSWPDIYWAEGHYNLGYDWLLTAIRMWMDTGDHMWWEIARRFAQWQFTTGLCWSGNYTGWQWYEKGKRGNEVGSDYWPSSYKQYALGMCLAKIIWDGEWWIEDGFNAFKEAIANMTAGPWTPDWGERKFGWAMMNCTALYRVTGDERFRTNGINKAKEWIEYCKSRTDECISAGIKVDQRWNKSDLGMPFIANKASTPKYYGQAWEAAKCANGLINVSFFLNPEKEDKDLFHRKLMQFAQWSAESVCELSDGVIKPKNRITYDDVPAHYWNGYIQFNTPGDIEANLSWQIGPIGYGALFGIESCREIFHKAVVDYASYPELPVGNLIHYKYWEGQAVLDKISAGLFRLQNDSGQSLDNLIPGLHQVRLKAADGTETMHEIKEKNDSFITIDDSAGILNHNISYQWIVTGPHTIGIKGMADKAIAKFIETEDPSLPKLRSSEFNWSNGQHFNTWMKNIQAVLYQWDTPYIVKKMLDALDTNVQVSIGKNTSDDRAPVPVEKGIKEDPPNIPFVK
jgi:hypothetical protein